MSFGFYIKQCVIKNAVAFNEYVCLHTDENPYAGLNSIKLIMYAHKRPRIKSQTDITVIK